MAKKKEETSPSASVSAGLSSRVELALAAIHKKFGKEAALLLDSRPSEPVPVIPTGSFGLDQALGVGGYPKGRVIEAWGPEGAGKSTLALQAVAEAQRMGVVCAYVDAEHSLSVAYAQALKIKTGELILSQPDYGEQGLEIVETLISSGAVGMVVVDSVAALTPKSEIDGEMGDAQMGAHARLMSQALRKLTALVHRRNAVVIFINQVRNRIGGYGNPETTTGGNALKFYASVRLEVRRLTVVKAGENIIGSRVRVKVLKNKVAPPFKEAEFEIIFGQGIQRDREVIDLALRYGVIQQAGSWFSVDGERVGHGREALVQWFGANPKHALKIEAKVKDLSTKVPPPVQETPAEPESATDDNPVTLDPDESDVPI